MEKEELRTAKKTTNDEMQTADVRRGRLDDTKDIARDWRRAGSAEQRR
jgi:hypothetical protein